METAYKITHNETHCIVFFLEDVLEIIKTEFESQEDEIGTKFELEIIEMTEKEIEELPEFEGF